MHYYKIAPLLLDYYYSTAALHNVVIFQIGLYPLTMHLDPEHLSFISLKLHKKINILIVDDYPLIRNALTEMFSSSLFNVCIASSAKEARTTIPSLPVWHGWILDIAMEESESGLSLLAEYADYPFCIMLSGIRSMLTASRAMELGAYKVYDKDPSILPQMQKETCGMAALAYILKGRASKYFSLFEILSRETVTTAEEWAEKACLTTRQLERIALTHFDMTPRFILPFFYVIRYLLLCDPAANSCNEAQCTSSDEEFIAKHLCFVYKNKERFFH